MRQWAPWQWTGLAVVSEGVAAARGIGHRIWKSPGIVRVRQASAHWVKDPYHGVLTLFTGSAVLTLLLWLSSRFFAVPNLGAIYIPLIAMLAYYWRWRLAIAACVVQLLAVYLVLLPPSLALKPLNSHTFVQLLLLAAISVYVLLLVQLARNRRFAAEREVERFAALNAVGTALSGELHETQLLRLIAQTACNLTEAGYAAFTLRPVDAMGQLLGPSEGSRFHLAAVVGATPEEEALFRRMPLGGEGILAPIFRYGVTVRVDDALALLPASHHASTARRHPAHSSHAAAPDGNAPRESKRDAARRQALAYAHGKASADDLRAVGIPRGHPVTRSFLGAPLLDRDGNVRGGLLLGHNEPGRFTKDDEILLNALAAQASVALENARLYHNVQSQAEELNAVVESISDGVMVFDHQGVLLRENHAAASIRASLERQKSGQPGALTMADALSRLALGQTNGRREPGAQSAHFPFTITDGSGEARDYVVNVSPLEAARADEELAAMTDATEPVETPDGDRQANQNGRAGQAVEALTGGSVVVWHEVTATRRLLAEQQARAEAESRRGLLQTVIDELPSAVYLVCGYDVRLMLANEFAHEAWGAHWPEGMPMANFLASSGVQFVGSGGRPLDMSELATVRTVRDGEPIHHYQEVIRRPDGTSLPVLLNAVILDPRLLEATRPAMSGDETRTEPERFALVVLQDVTAIKEAERLKDEFIAIAAHELKTPMASVKGYADMLMRHSEDDEGSALQPWQVEALETIDQATNRLVELTEDLLDVARLQAERLQLHIEPHDLIALARRVMKRFQMASDRHTLSLVASDDFVVAALDVRRTEQIIGNLLSNAIKYSPAGGSVVVTVEQDTAAGVAKLSVSDSGIGIPADQQAMLFNRFSRADNARELGITGTGLGLYLCRELTELQGGQLWFTSDEGHGSTFYLTLPLAEESA
jgi:signal transduction histidine kinase/GAF domain-containing protein